MITPAAPRSRACIVAVATRCSTIWPSPAPGPPASDSRQAPGHRQPRLVGAVLAEQHDEWTEGRRYLGLDVLARSRITPHPQALAQKRR